MPCASSGAFGNRHQLQTVHKEKWLPDKGANLEHSRKSRDGIPANAGTFGTLYH